MQRGNHNYLLEMSRIPQRSPLKYNSSSATLSPSGNVNTRQKILSTSSSPTPTLRSQKSQTSIKLSKSPVRPRKASLESDEPSTESPTQLSIKERIALKRADLKKTSLSSKTPEFDSSFQGLEDVNPLIVGNKHEQAHLDDFGRWSIRETIERARSTGESCLEHVRA